MRRFICLLFFISPVICSGQNVVINEIMAVNGSTKKDASGNYSDWIELKNNSGTPYDLASHYISDNKTKPKKFQFTSQSGKVVIPAYGYLLIWASGNIEDGYNHTSFSLSSSGESVVLSLPDGETIIDEIDFGPQVEDVSYGLNSTNEWVYFSPATPESANLDEDGFDGFLTPPSFSRPGGFFNSNFNLTLSHPDPGVEIYYTTDGSDPDLFNTSGTSYNYKDVYPKNPGDGFGSMHSRDYISHTYSTPILVSDRTNENNQLSTINTTIAHDPPAYLPSYKVPKATIIRAYAFKSGYLPSKVISHTYIYSANSKNPYSFPVASVVTQENNLLDYENGIYTPGKVFDDARLAEPNADLTDCPPGNFKIKGKATQKTGNFELFENNSQVLNNEIGIRINGGCTTGFPYKSLRLYGDKQFDKFKFFDDDPNLLANRLILRNSGNDQFMTLFKDEFAQEWMKHLNFASQRYKPSVLYLNGEYWGVHNIRERIDKYFLQNNFGVDPDNIDLRKVVFPGFGPDEMSEGDDVHYNNMYNFIMNNSMTSSSNYNHVKTMLVTESLIDLYIAHLYIGNIDWPQNNIRLWRTRNTYDPEAGYSDGRWRYIFYDADRSLGEMTNSAHNFLNEVFYWNISDRRSEMFVKLLDNASFRNDFVNRFADLLNTSLRKEFALPIFDSLKDKYAVEVGEHLKRWKAPFLTKTAWENDMSLGVAGVRSYVDTRENYIIDHLEEVGKPEKPGQSDREGKILYVNGQFNLTVKSQHMNYGYVVVNSIVIHPDSTRGLSMSGRTWTGKYFKSIPVKITAKPQKGYKFTHWMHNGNKVYTQEITVNTSSNKTYEAFFQYTGLSENPYPETFDLKECDYSFNNWPSSSTAGTYPANAAFINWAGVTDPTINDVNSEYALVTGSYDHSSNTRINGLDEEGVSFVNHSDGNTGYHSGGLGGMVVALNTKNMSKVHINWKAKTVNSGDRKYGVRLLYRVGDMAFFAAFGPSYTSGATGDSTVFNNIELPANALNKEYVQLLWQYYYTGSGSSGARDELAISDIEIYEVIDRPDNLAVIGNSDRPGIVKSKEKISSSGTRKEHASKYILLSDGFEAKAGSVFSAVIKQCTKSK